MASKQKLSKVQERGQVTIPIELRERYGLEPGDMVAFIETADGILISPQEVLAMRALDKLGEILKEKGIAFEDLVESGRDIRGQLVEEEYEISEAQ